MGINFSDSTNKDGLYEEFQDLTGTKPTSFSKVKFARRANDAFARLMWLAIKASQKHQADDTNQTDYPIITLNIVSGQQDYSFTTDASDTPNQIWTVDRVEIKDASGNWVIVDPSDEMAEKTALSQTKSGTPTKYYQLANGIWFDYVPNYNSTNGMKVYFKRAPVYFIGDGTDDSNVAGIPEMFQEYLYIRPAYIYALRHLPRLAQGYLNEVIRIENEVASYYFMRNANQRKNMVANVENTR